MNLTNRKMLRAGGRAQGVLCALHVPEQVETESGWVREGLLSGLQRVGEVSAEGETPCGAVDTF